MHEWAHMIIILKCRYIFADVLLIISRRPTLSSKTNNRFQSLINLFITHGYLLDLIMKLECSILRWTAQTV